MVYPQFALRSFTSFRAVKSAVTQVTRLLTAILGGSTYFEVQRHYHLNGPGGRSGLIK